MPREWEKNLNFCVRDFLLPYLGVSNTPYLGSDVTLLCVTFLVLEVRIGE